MERRRLLKTGWIGIALLAGCSSNTDAGPEPTGTPMVTEELTPPPNATGKDLARWAAERGLGRGFSNGIREIDFKEMFDAGGATGEYLMDIRYNLDAQGVDSHSEAEERGGKTAINVFASIFKANPNKIREIAIFSYSSGSVSLKVVVKWDEVKNINWDNYQWTRLENDADQYDYVGY